MVPNQRLEVATPTTTTAVKLIDKEGNVDLTLATPVVSGRGGGWWRPGRLNSILNYGVEVQNSMEK